MRHTVAVKTPPEFEHIRTIERPDRFYWQDKTTEETYGPFSSIQEAMADAKHANQTEGAATEPLAEAEAEMGMADWIDPETGQPAEEWVPRLEDPLAGRS